MLGQRERAAIARLWQRKLEQDARGLPQAERHRNLEPPSAEFFPIGKGSDSSAEGTPRRPIRRGTFLVASC
jgi:hypothetical protein